MDGASFEDFAILVFDSCPHQWERQNIYDTLEHFDYPVVIGHWSCQAVSVSSDASSGLNSYGLHVAELAMLLHHRISELDAVGEASSEGSGLICSVSTTKSLGSSRFLNDMWSTRFAESSDSIGVYHDGMIQIHLGHCRKRSAIVDVQGTVDSLPEVVLRSIIKFAGMCIITCCSRDFQCSKDGDCAVSGALSRVLSYVPNNSAFRPVVVVAVRGIRDVDNSGFTDCIKRSVVTSVSPSEVNVHVFPFAGVYPTQSEIEDFHKFIPLCLAEAPIVDDQVLKLCSVLSSACGTDQASGLCVRCTNTSSSLDSFRDELSMLVTSDVATWFPLQDISKEIATLDNQLYDKGRQSAEIRLQQNRLAQGRSHCRETCVPVNYFLNVVAHSQYTIEAMEIFQQELNKRFMPKAHQARKKLTALKTNLRSTTSASTDLISEENALKKKLLIFDVSNSKFVREIIELGVHNRDVECRSNARNAAKTIYEKEFSIGRSVEIVNGDAGTVQSEFLQAIDWDSMMNSGERQPFVSITIVGAESSGKSTLWNELWDTNFPVSHGKCSKGFWSAFAHFRNGPNLIVNDTEGILSPINNDPRFNQRLILYAFSVSHIVILNIRGEGDRSLVEIMKLVIYAAHKLSLFHRPRLVFVNRDVMGRKEHEQAVLKNVVFDELHQACRSLHVKLEEVLDVSDICGYDLPTAIVEPSRVVAGEAVKVEAFTPEFSGACRRLRLDLLKIAEESSKRSAQFPRQLNGYNGWIRKCADMWQLSRQNADLYTFHSVTEKLQMEYVEGILRDLYVEYLTSEFRSKCSEVMHALVDGDINYRVCLGDSIEDVPVTDFCGFAETFGEILRGRIKEKLKARVADYGGGDIPSGLCDRFIAKVDLLVEEAVHEQRNIYDDMCRTNSCREKIALAFKSVDEAISELNGKDLERSQLEDIFDLEVTKVRSQFLSQLESTSSRDRAVSIKKCYCEMSHSFKRFPFASDYLNRCVNADMDCPETLQLIQGMASGPRSATSNNAALYCVKEMMANIDPQIFQQGNSAVTQSRFDVFKRMVQRVIPFFHHDTPNHDVSSIMNDVASKVKELHQRVVTCLVTEENNRSSSLDWQALVWKTASVTDEMLNDITNLPTFHEWNSSISGAFQTLINESHSMSCRILLTYSRFHAKHRRMMDIAEFTEYANQQRRHVLLKAQRAENMYALADEIAKRIFDGAILDAGKQAEKSLELDMASWSISPTTLFDKAVQQTFVRRDVEAVWSYLDYPSGWIKTHLFEEEFESAFNAAKQRIYEKELSLSRNDSTFSRKVNSIKRALATWQRNIIGSRGTISALTALFGLKEISFLRDSQASCLGFARNTLRHSNNNDVFTFANRLARSFADITGKNQFPIHCFRVPSHLFSRMNQKSWQASRGCGKCCPYCNHKCTAGPMHVKHACSHHMLQAFTGYRYRHTRNPALTSCSDPTTFKNGFSSRVGHGKHEFIPFEQHIAKHHNDWTILPVEDDVVSDGEKACWVSLRHRFAEKYGYTTVTPPEWLEMYGECND